MHSSPSHLRSLSGAGFYDKRCSAPHEHPCRLGPIPPTAFFACAGFADDTPTVFRSELSAIFVPSAPRSLEHILAAASILA